MSKIDLGPSGFIYPMPVTLVGSDLDEYPSFMTLAWVNRVQPNPPRLVVGMGKVHETNVGIRAHGEFSINFPDESMAAAVDWAGITSSRTADKSAEFTVFRGKLEHAPMVAECSLSLECSVWQTIDLGSHELFIADIVATWTEERFLDDRGKPDAAAMKPFMLTMPDNRYWGLGDVIGDAWRIGRTYEPKG